MKSSPSFSVLISVYHNDNPDYFNKALLSLQHQSLPPNEIVIVNDGTLPENLLKVQRKFLKTTDIKVKIIEITENVGLGLALQKGIKNCEYDYIARMDSDDVSLPNRFKTQMDYLALNPHVDVLGGLIREVSKENTRIRKTPSEYKKIKSMMKFRNPMNHVSVVMKKRAVINSGSYVHMPFFEDYYLWFRMIKNYVFQNIDYVLVEVRVDNDMVGRRHGIKYIKHEVSFYDTIRREGFINLIEFFLTLAVRIPPRLLSKNLLNIFYQKTLRT